MNLKQDLQKYRSGDRAAEMRLLSFVDECIQKENIRQLEQFVGEDGRLGREARIGVQKCANSLARRQADLRLKKQINLVLEGTQRMLASPSDCDMQVLNINCKYLSAVRWQLAIDQETYNIDLKIRQALEKAKKLGIKA